MNLANLTLSESFYYCYMMRQEGLLNYSSIFGLIFILWFKLPLLGQTNTYNSSSLDLRDGIPGRQVTAIAQDRLGYIWIGTRNGMAKYDGLKIRYLDSPSNKPLGKSIETIYTSSDGKIWIGTKNKGVSIYDPHTDKAKNLFYHPNNGPNGLSGNRVFQIFEFDGHPWVVTRNDGLNRYLGNDKFEHHDLDFIINEVAIGPNGLFWIGTDSNGLIIYDPKSKKVTPFPIQRLTTLKTSKFGVRQIKFSTDKTVLWMSTWEHGVFKIDLSDRFNPIVKKITIGSDGESQLSYAVYSLIIASDGKVWCGTWGYGIFILENDEVVKRIEPSSIESESIVDGIILNLYEDSNKNIWATTEKGTVKVFDTSSPVKNIVEPDNKLDNNSRWVNSMLVKEESIMIGYRLGGLSVYNSTTDMITPYKQMSYPYNPRSNVNAIYEDQWSKIWIGDYNNGVYFIDQKKGITPRQTTFKGTKATSIVPINTNQLLVGFQRRGIGLITLNNDGEIINTKEYDEIFETQKHPSIFGIRSIEIYNDDQIIISAYNGIFITDTSFSFIKKVFDSTTICSFQLDDTHLLFGTEEGLYSLDLTNDHLELLPLDKTALANQLIHFIEQGATTSTYWIGTNREVFLVDIVKLKVIKRLNSGYFGYNNPSENCSLKKGDKIYFGGSHGISILDINTVKAERKPSPIIITDILNLKQERILAGQEYNGQVIIQKQISYADTITLNHKNDMLQLEFSTMDYLDQYLPQFEYHLSYQDQWIPLGSNTSLILNNLDFGDHQLTIRNKDNIAISQSIHLKVLPPIWLSFGAKSIYTILSILLLATAVQFIYNRYQLKEKIRVKRLSQEKERDLVQLKLQFFTNISHELRTPLALIAAPLEDIMNSDKLTPALKEKAELMMKNVRSLSRLADQLINFRKAESDKMAINLSKSDIVPYCAQIIQEFNNKSKSPNNFILDAEVDSLYVYFDPSYLEIILYNLIINALKHSNTNAPIKLKLRVDQESFYLSIIDQGVGIAPKDIPKLTDRFFQLGSSNKSSGAGIGLALVQRLTKYLNGELEIKSEINVGSEFTVKLPASDSFYTDLAGSNDNVSIDSASATTNTSRTDEVEDLFTDTTPNNDASKHDESGTSILLVEDNPELLAYLKSSLNHKHTIFTANNGKEALNTIRESDIDLIVSDVMMPEMNGIELCKTIQGDIAISHVPLIFLTAKTDDLSQVEGIRIGAEDYITKPFSPSVLDAKIDMVLQKRETLRNYYRTEFLLEPKNIEHQNENEVFLSKLQSIVEEHLLDNEVMKEKISTEMAMSRATLYRKLKGLTNQSISEFVRSIRIKKASLIILNSSKSISEVAYSVGFNDLKYFRQCFAEAHQMSPREYRNKHK